MNKEKIKEWLKKDIRKLTLDEYYIILIYLAGGTFIVVFTFLIGSLFTFDVDNIVKLLVPFGVLLSAGLASISVMKSIDNTNRIEREKKEKKLQHIFNRLEYYINQLSFNIEGYNKAFETLELLIKKEKKIEFQHIKLLHNKTNHILTLIREDSELIETIENELIVYIIMNNEIIIDILEQVINQKPKNDVLANIKRDYYKQIKRTNSVLNHTLEKYNLNKINYSESSN